MGQLPIDVEIIKKIYLGEKYQGQIFENLVRGALAPRPTEISKNVTAGR